LVACARLAHNRLAESYQEGSFRFPKKRNEATVTRFHERATVTAQTVPAAAYDPDEPSEPEEAETTDEVMGFEPTPAAPAVERESPAAVAPLSYANSRTLVPEYKDIPSGNRWLKLCVNCRWCRLGAGRTRRDLTADGPIRVIFIAGS